MTVSLLLLPAVFSVSTWTAVLLALLCVGGWLLISREVKQQGRRLLAGIALALVLTVPLSAAVCPCDCDEFWIIFWICIAP